MKKNQTKIFHSPKLQNYSRRKKKETTWLFETKINTYDFFIKSRRASTIPRRKENKWLLHAHSQKLLLKLLLKGLWCWGYSKGHPLPTAAPSVEKVIRRLDSSSSSTCQTPLWTSHLLNILAFETSTTSSSKLVLSVKSAVAPCSILSGQYTLEHHHSTCTWLLKLTCSLMARSCLQ